MKESIYGALLRAMRPGQWIKNLFVIAPLLFGKSLLNGGPVVRTIAAAAAFCAMASALYLINDVADREADRLHPTKKKRPIASGALPLSWAISASAVLVFVAVTLVLVFTPEALGALLSYAVLTTTYTYILKKIALLDVLVIASGFVIRVVAGAKAATVQPSHWLLLCTFFLALFLALGKRKKELQDQGSSARASLATATPALLGDFQNVALGITIVSYTLYTVSPETVAWFGSDRLLVSVPFVVFGLFRWRLQEARGGGEDPSSDLFGDPALLVNVALWGILCAALIYLVPRGYSFW
jgi:4-hydroxybenzoate polyprenyltransferase